jgi:hypothetical protein
MCCVSDFTFQSSPCFSFLFFFFFFLSFFLSFFFIILPFLFSPPPFLSSSPSNLVFAPLLNRNQPKPKPALRRVAAVRRRWAFVASQVRRNFGGIFFFFFFLQPSTFSHPIPHCFQIVDGVWFLTFSVLLHHLVVRWWGAPSPPQGERYACAVLIHGSGWLRVCVCVWCCCLVWLHITNVSAAKFC